MNTFLPFSQRALRVLAYVSVWTAFALLSASQSIATYYATGGTANVGAVLRISLLIGYTWAALGPAVLWLAKRFPLGRRNWWKHVPLHVAFNIFFAFAAVAIYRAAREAIGLPSQRVFRVELLGGITGQVVTYWILVGVAHAASYYRRAREREITAAELTAELSEARLDALRMQLHPHFLFNTMHAIASAVREDPERAEDMLAELSDLLRATLERPATHEVPLGEELTFIQRYVGIQKVRFGDRLDVSVAVDEALLDVLVPTLILQPLVENAIEHGIATRLRGGRLELSAAASDDTLILRVSDDGPGIPDADLQPHRTQVGLRNTRARLAHLYGPTGALELKNCDDGGLTATVKLPLRRAQPLHRDGAT